MVYGGTIRPGSCEGAPQLDVVSAFQSYGKYLQDGRTEAAEKERYNTVRHACPGPGACGGVRQLATGSFDPVDADPQDVHRKYNGECRGGIGNDTSRRFFFPRRVQGEVGRMRFGGTGLEEPCRKEHPSSRYHDESRL